MGTVGFVHLQSFTDIWQKKGQGISFSAAWNVLGLKKKKLTYLRVKMLSLCSPKQTGRLESGG